MYVHSLVVKKDLQLRHGAIVELKKRQLIKKHPETLGPRESRCVCWTNMMVWISSSLDICTYVYIPYVRSAQVKSGRDRTYTSTYICRNPAARQKILSYSSIHTRIPRPNEKYQRCEDHRPTVSRLFFFHSIHFSPSPTPSHSLSPALGLNRICPDITYIPTYLYIPYRYTCGT